MAERPPADTQTDIRRRKGRIPTSELNYQAPVISIIRGYDNVEDLEGNWSKLFYSEYIQADDFRQKGQYEKALEGYRNVQFILNAVKESGIHSEALLVRLATCHYMIMQCYINLQRSTDFLMREKHNFSLVLMEMLEKVIIEEDEIRMFLDPLKEMNEQENSISVQEIYHTLVNFLAYINKMNSKTEEEDDDSEYLTNLDDEFLSDFEEAPTIEKSRFEKNFEDETYPFPEDRKIWAWKLAFFIAHHAIISHEFYMNCTRHVEKADMCHVLTRSAGNLAQDLLEDITPEAIESDPESVNQTYAKMTHQWLSEYHDFLNSFSSILIGDAIMSSLYVDGDKRSRLEKRISKYGAEEKGDITRQELQAFEHSIEVLAIVNFASAYGGIDGHKEPLEKLHELHEFATKHKISRLQILTQIYIAQVNIMIKRTAKAQEALDIAHKIRAENSDYSSKGHKLDVWMNILSAECLLTNHDDTQAIVQMVRDRQFQIGFAESVQVVNPPQYNPNEHLGLISSLEGLFSEYTSKNARIERQTGVYLPMEAQSYYILGRASIEKARVYGRELPEDKDSKTGKQLLDAFYDARYYLCEAYSILKDMGYQDAKMLDKIAEAYLELIDLNYTLSGIKEEEKDGKLPQRQDMDEIVMHYQLQKWIEVVFETILSNNLSTDNYVSGVSDSLEKGIKRIIPEVSELKIVDKKGDGWDLSVYDSEKKEMVLESLNKAGGKPISESYFYHTKHGKIILAAQLDRSEDRKIVLETDMPLTKHSVIILRNICRGVTLLLNLFDQRKKLDEETDPEKIKKSKKEILKTVSKVFSELFEIHKPTATHSASVAEILLRSVHKMQDEDPDIDLDDEEIFYAGLLHDTGKLGLDPKLILDKATRLLPFEIDKVESHAILTAKLLRGLLGLKHFKNIIAIAVAHHIKYGVDRGYPFNLPGDEIKYILRNLAEHFDNLTDEEREILMSEDSILSDELCDVARDIVIIDQVQALRAKDRLYRRPMPPKVLNGYLLSRTGRDFDPDRMERFIELIRGGYTIDHLAHSMQDASEFKEFESPKVYDWDKIYRFVVENKESLESKCGIPLDFMVDYLAKGYKKGLKMSHSCLGAGLCDVYITLENEEIGDMNEARDKGREKYFEKREDFFELFNDFMVQAA